MSGGGGSFRVKITKIRKKSISFIYTIGIGISYFGKYALGERIWENIYKQKIRQKYFQ